MARQKVIIDPGVAAFLSGNDKEEHPEAESNRKRRRYPSEEKRSKATYTLSPETVEAVREIAEQERFGLKQISVVAEALLLYSVEAYRAGRVCVEMVPDGEIAGGQRWKPVLKEVENAP
jgi:hypothetical protein